MRRGAKPLLGDVANLLSRIHIGKVRRMCPEAEIRTPQSEIPPEVT